MSSDNESDESGNYQTDFDIRTRPRCIGKSLFSKTIVPVQGIFNEEIGILHVVEHNKNFMYPIVAITNQYKMEMLSNDKSDECGNCQTDFDIRTQRKRMGKSSSSKMVVPVQARRYPQRVNRHLN